MRWLKSLRANILVGIVLTAPVVATVLIFDFFFRRATNWLPDSAFSRLQGIWDGYLLRFITLVAVLIFFYFTGLLVRTFLGMSLYALEDRILRRMPLIKTIYETVRQVGTSFFTHRKSLFKKVVLIQYPRKSLYSLAFITATAPETIRRIMSGGDRETTQDCVSVFMATTPNPTLGVLILAPRSKTIPLPVSVPDALTVIMSAEAVQPEQTGITDSTLLDKIGNLAIA